MPLRVESGTPSRDERLQASMRFYELLDELGRRVGGPRLLSDCNGRQPWPKRGVYFFFEPGELRSGSGPGARVVRVGTHALAAGSRATLWGRLAQHKGDRSGGGNHRGSVFRLHVGSALRAGDLSGRPATWGARSSAAAGVRDGEALLERRVSAYLGQMSVVWLAVDDDAGPASMRGYVERNAIALLSEFAREPIDPPSDGWLGRLCSAERVVASGLWNVNHVELVHEPEFVSVFERLVLGAPRCS